MITRPAAFQYGRRRVESIRDGPNDIRVRIPSHPSLAAPVRPDERPVMVRNCLSNGRQSSEPFQTRRHLPAVPSTRKAKLAGTAAQRIPRVPSKSIRITSRCYLEYRPREAKSRQKKERKLPHKGFSSENLAAFDHLREQDGLGRFFHRFTPVAIAVSSFIVRNNGL